MDALKTEYQIAREKKEQAVFDEHTALMLQPGAMVTEVTKAVQKAYNIKSYSTVWAILKRVRKRIAETPAETVQ